MSEPASSGFGAVLLYKLLPATLGAAIMIAVDPPVTKREMFMRAFVAMAFSFLFGDLAFEFAAQYVPVLNPFKPSHWTAVAGVVGAGGWFVAGAANVWLKRLKFKEQQ
jgi:hypothetical protein